MSGADRSSLASFYAEAKASDSRRRHELGRAQRSHQARVAGKASARARRARSVYPNRRKAPHSRSRQRALALAYPVRQLTRTQFDRLYEQTFDYVNDRGRATTYELYRAHLAAYRARSQNFRTTNAQQARALGNRGRPRCSRTVQRQRARLVEMGLVQYTRVRRQAALPQDRDVCLSVCLLIPGVARTYVTPPSGAGTAPLRVAVLPASQSSAPPYGGRDRPPDELAGDGGNDQESASRPETPEQPPLPYFDLAVTRKTIERDLASGERRSIFERFGVS